MQIRVLDLDGAISQQSSLLRRHEPRIHDLRRWGPRLRMGCRFKRFGRFELSLKKRLAREGIFEPALTFYGSGDFHHVSLALVRQIIEPFNLLVIDNHPDWMRGLPFLHCGTWLYHAARLPMVQNVYHVGGDVDFDNGFRWLAPWRMLREGKISVLPSVRTFTRGSWKHVVHEPLRPNAWTRLSGRRMERLIQPWERDLQRWPLYISLDKDVMVARDSAVNWDSGHLEMDEVRQILLTFMNKARGRLVGMDIVGDWSPVESQGLFRKFLHWTEHPALELHPLHATRRNEQGNLSLLNALIAERAVAKNSTGLVRLAS